MTIWEEKTTSLHSGEKKFHREQKKLIKKERATDLQRGIFLKYHREVLLLKKKGGGKRVYIEREYVLFP